MTTKERPILFSAAMVRAILAGRKTQTRRIVNCCCNGTHNGRLLGAWGLSRPPFMWEGDQDEVNWRHYGKPPRIGEWVEHYQTDVDDYASQNVRCPYGQPGDRLWVRETHMIHGDEIAYAATDQPLVGCGKWKPSIFMPRCASRIGLEVSEIRVERLQAITDDDALREGVANERQRESTWYEGKAVGMFRDLWTKINGVESWRVNPWVWVVSFVVAKSP